MGIFEPVISVFDFDGTVLTDWLKQTNYLEDWVSQFRVANSEKYQGVITATVVIKRKKESQLALKKKTLS